MDSNNSIYSWIIVILIIVPFVVDHYSYKRGFEDGKEGQVIRAAENIGESCEDYMADKEYEFCKNAVSNSGDYYCEDYHLNEISDNRRDICADLVSEAKSDEQSNFESQIDEREISNEALKDKLEEQQEFIDAQKDYQDCVSLSTNSRGYIKPSDEEFCRNMYLR